MRRVAGAAAALSIAFAITSCSSLEPSGDTYCSVYSCPDGGGLASTFVDASPDSPWWCEKGTSATTVVSPPTYPADAMPTTVRYVVPIVDFASVAGVQPRLVDPRAIVVLACPGGDCPDGGSTIATPPSAAAPVYQVNLPYGFQGAILVTNSPSPPPGATPYLPTEYFFGGAMVGTRLADGSALRSPVDGVPIVNGIPITPIDVVKLASFFAGLGPMLDPTKGLLVARLLDCNGNRVAGAMLNVTGATGIGYTLYNDYLPVPGPVVTDIHAVSGYANMVTGNYSVTATTPDGRTYGQSTVASIRPNTLTEVELRTDIPPQVGR